MSPMRADTCKGVEQLAAFLQQNPNLVELNLYDSQVTQRAVM